MNLFKIVYLLWPPRDQDTAKTKEILLKDIAPKLISAGAERLSMDIHDADSAVRSPAPKLYRGRPIGALVNVWVEDTGKRRTIEDVLRYAGFHLAGYLVEESIYRDYGGNSHSGPRDWPDGRRSPGVVAVTLLERPKRIPRDEWIRRWHDTMSPVSEAIQPRARYVRNVVIEPLTEGALPFGGIVEEVWPSRKHVTSYYLFYGARNPRELARNMLRILRAVTSFLELRKIRTTMMSEYFIKTR